MLCPRQRLELVGRGRRVAVVAALQHRVPVPMAVMIGCDVQALSGLVGGRTAPAAITATADNNNKQIKQTRDIKEKNSYTLLGFCSVRVLSDYG